MNSSLLKGSCDKISKEKEGRSRVKGGEEGKEERKRQRSDYADLYQVVHEHCLIGLSK